MTTATPQKKEVLIRLYEDSKEPGTCKSTKCGAEIDYYETLNGKRMPMDKGAVPRKSESEAGTNRVIAYFSNAESHFATCQAADEFRRK